VSRKFAVRVFTLIELLHDENVHNVDDLKIDVEGMESEVLVPYFRAARSEAWPKSIIIEHTMSSHWPVDVFQILSDAGYVVRSKSRGNTWLVRP
jgi:hypothetical protein